MSSAKVVAILSQPQYVNPDQLRLLTLHHLSLSDAYICHSNLTILGSDNGLAPARRQAIIWTNDGSLSEPVMEYW